MPAHSKPAELTDAEWQQLFLHFVPDEKDRGGVVDLSKSLANMAEKLRRLQVNQNTPTTATDLGFGTYPRQNQINDRLKAKRSPFRLVNFSDKGNQSLSREVALARIADKVVEPPLDRDRTSLGILSDGS